MSEVVLKVVPKNLDEIKAMKITSKEQLIGIYKTMLGANQAWAIRGLMVVYGNQTADEQQEGSVRVHNGKGFTPTDAKFLSSLAEQYKTKNSLSAKQVEVLYQKMPKYARQILDESFGKGTITKVGREYKFK